MGAVASLSQASLAVDAGADVSLTVQIKNDGAVVDEFSVEVLGPTHGWAIVEPATLSLFPEASGVIHVTFRPPRAPSTAAGIAPFGIMVHSSEDPTRSTVEEGQLHIAPYLDPSAELIPRTSRGSRTGHHEVAIDNRGNVPFDADLVGQDPDRNVGFEFEPPSVSVDPGTAGFAKVRIKPAQSFWRGASKTRSFQIEIKPHAEAQAPLLVAGSMLQESILPPWFLRAVMTAVGLLVAALLLWIFVLQPQIKSSAAQVLNDFGFSPVPSRAASPSASASASASTLPSLLPPSPSAAASAVVSAPPSVPPTLAPPSESTEPSPSAPPSVEPSASIVVPSGPVVPTPVPTVVPTVRPTPTPIIITPPPVTPAPSRAVQQFPVSVRLDANAGAYQAASNTQLFVTDLVFSNPSGASGTTVLQVNGKTILSLKLDNYRDLDFHFVTPIVVNPGQSMRFIPRCTGTGTCDAAVLFSGYLQATR